MTISSAIKRLQFLEDQHGGHVGVMIVHVTDEETITTDDVVFDVIDRASQRCCCLMPQSYWEEITPKGIDYKQV